MEAWPDRAKLFQAKHLFPAPFGPPGAGAADPEKFFTEPHYNGFPAVLVRLPAVDVGELAELITDAWRCQAPRALVAEFGRPPQ